MATTIKKGLFYLLVCCGTVLILITLLSLLYDTSLWYLQDLNFPRFQTLLLLVVCLIILPFCSPKKRLPTLLFAVGLLSCTVIQAYIIYPYSPFAKQKILSANPANVEPGSVFSIMLANVLMPNRQSKGLIEQIKQRKPSMLLTMEVDKWWMDQLSSFEKDYPYRISFPTNNTYGMALYSKLPIENQLVRFLNQDSVPSFQMDVTLPNGSRFHLFTIHPVAPKSSEHHPDNVGRKEQALPLAARFLRDEKLPVIVAGDFNDVGWSHNTQRFEETSHLSDVRYGRGMLSTFDEKSWIFRWPLDYVFATPQYFRVLRTERLDGYGSDHFPYFVELTLLKQPVNP